MLYWDESQRLVEERVVAARQYAERLQSRAETVLTPEQLRRYADRQESSLARIESSLPYQDSLTAAGLTSATKSN